MILKPGGLLTRIMCLAKLAILTILAIVFGGFLLLLPMMWPVKKENVIGTYQSVLVRGTPELPDGGSEILELKADGTCRQEIVLKDGRTFSAQGIWEWKSDGTYLSERIIITGIYWTVDIHGNINPKLERSIKGVVQGFPVGRTLTGRVMLGSDEGPHYEKK